MELQTASDVFETLGGVRQVSELLGVTYKAAFNWKQFGRFPPNTYVALTEALAEHNKQASPSLWGMKEPDRAPTHDEARS